MLVKHCCGLRVTSMTCNYEGEILTLKAIANPFIQDSLIKRRLEMEVYKSNSL